MSDSTDVVVKAEGLSKRFGEIRALDNLDLEVPRNSIFGFLGPNGSGKTTTMKLLLGLSRPTGGSARVLGLDIERQSIEIRRRVGYLPQHPVFYDDLNARETLRYARGFFPKDSDRHVESEIDAVLELVGLDSKADRPVGKMSGGERQRLGIAQAQIHHPELLILDEPASALDPLGRRDVLEVMLRLRETTTVFYSTHILDDVQRVSDTVAILSRGTRVAQASIESLLGGPTASVFELVVRGSGSDVADRLRRQSWARRVEERPVDDTTVIEVAVSEERVAEERLLRVALESPISIVSYGRRRTELEDVFIDLVADR